MTVIPDSEDDFDFDDEIETGGPDSHIKAVVLDLGGVVLANGPRLAVISRLLGRTSSTADQEEVRAAIWKHRTEYDLGSEADDYWRKVADELGAPDDFDVSRVTAAEADRWGHPLPDAIDLLDELEESRVKVAALCNAPRQLARVFDDQEWAEVFTAARFSGVVGILVPDRRMFELIEEDLGVRPDQVVFFDNSEKNVAGAKEHGWDARLWQDGRAAHAQLVELGVLV